MATSFSVTQHTENQKAVHEVWNIFPDTIQQLMLFSWAGVQIVYSLCNNMAHPNLGNSTAKDILDHNFQNTFKKYLLE